MRGFLRRVKGRGGMKIYILIIYILRKCAGFFQLCNDAGGDHCIARRSPTPSNTLQPSQTLPTLQPSQPSQPSNPMIATDPYNRTSPHYNVYFVTCMNLMFLQSSHCLT